MGGWVGRGGHGEAGDVRVRVRGTEMGEDAERRYEAVEERAGEHAGRGVGSGGMGNMVVVVGGGWLRGDVGITVEGVRYR